MTLTWLCVDLGRAHSWVVLLCSYNNKGSCKAGVTYIFLNLGGRLRNSARSSTHLTNASCAYYPIGAVAFATRPGATHFLQIMEILCSWGGWPPSHLPTTCQLCTVQERLTISYMCFSRNHSILPCESTAYSTIWSTMSRYVDMLPAAPFPAYEKRL